VKTFSLVLAAYSGLNESLNRLPILSITNKVVVKGSNRGHFSELLYTKTAFPLDFQACLWDSKEIFIFFNFQKNLYLLLRRAQKRGIPC
jgi:hypothetical protein